MMVPRISDSEVIMMEGASSEGAIKEIKNILIKLLENYYSFFSRDERLNSDGIRLYKRISYFIHFLDEPKISSYRKSFRDPTFENILSFATLFLDDIDTLIEISINKDMYKTPYDNMLILPASKIRSMKSIK